MFLVNKSDLEVVRPLDEDEVDLLRGKASETQFLLRKYKNNGYWLACDCVPDYAYMTIRTKNDNTHLVNLSSRGEHDKSCYFYSLEKPNNPEYQKVGLKQSFVIHRPPTNSEIDPNAAPSVGGQKNKTTEDSLYSLVCCLFESAKINHFGSGSINHSYKNRVAAILNATKQFRAAKQPLEQILYWSIASHETAYNSLKKEVDVLSGGMESGVKMRIVVGVIDEFEFTSIGVVLKSHHFNKNRERVDNHVVLSEDCKITLANKRFSSEDSPFLAIYTLLYDTRNDKHEITTAKCYIRPISSIKTLIPIDNPIERIAYQKLKKLSQELSRQNRVLKIEKPLLPIKVDDSLVSVKPDFVLSSEHSQIWLNLFVSNEQSYLAARQGQLHRMESMAAVDTIDCTELMNEADGKVTIDREMLLLLIKNVIDGLL